MADFARRVILKACFRVTLPIRVTKRQVLTSSFSQQESFLNFSRQRKWDYGEQSLSSTCLLIDRCSEKSMPYSSLTIDSMVNAIEDRDDIISSMYYLHKFRHCDAGYFLRPWTSHTWVRKCVEFDALDLALKVLDENSQYGIFPDDAAFCLLLDKCLKQENYDLAVKFASHMFLTETLESKLSQLLSVLVVLKIMTQGNSLNPDFSSVAEQRNFSALCFRIGQLLNDCNLKILGLANLGAIEKEHGIRSVYQDPWGPLMWMEGYLEQAIAGCSEIDTPLHRDVIVHMKELVKDDDIKVDSMNKIVASLETRGLVNEEPLCKASEEMYLSQISEAEASAIKSFHAVVESWMNEHEQLHGIEKEIEKEKSDEREEYFEQQRLQKLSKKMAIEKLGYWEFMSDEKHEDVALHLRGDYVFGSSSDLDIERRIDLNSA